MEDTLVKNNFLTVPDRRPPKSKDKGEINDILEKYDSTFPYVHVADICGAKIQLKTNSKHISDLWTLNWYPHNSYPTRGTKVDGTVYVVNGIEGYDPHLFYNLTERKIGIVNSEYYGAAKSAGALGLAGVILKEQGGYPIHGACIGVEKGGKMEGIIIIAPTGTGKTTQSHELLYNLENTKIHSDDYVFVFFTEKPVSCATEKWLYMRTDIAEEHPTFIPLFRDLPIENVVTKGIDFCAQKAEKTREMGPCYRSVCDGERSCVFDEGADRCYWSYGNSRVMFPRTMFPMIVRGEDGSLYETSKKEENVVNEVPIKYVFLLTRDKDSHPIRKLDCEEAIATLKEGKYTVRPGAGPPEKWGQVGYEPFYNPYPPEMDKERQERFYRKLFDHGVFFYLLNTGSYKGMGISQHRTHIYIRNVIRT